MRIFFVKLKYNNKEMVYMKDFSAPPLKIKRRGDDGHRMISVRIREELLQKLDEIARETNYSRNELINLILQHGVETVEIE